MFQLYSMQKKESYGIAKKTKNDDLHQLLGSPLNISFSAVTKSFFLQRLNSSIDLH